VAGLIEEVSRPWYASQGKDGLWKQLTKLVESSIIMASWEPNQDGVREICQLLHEYLQPGVDQQAIFMQLQKCSQYPDFNNYLTYILTHADVRLDPYEIF
jgi:hypothetical protein